jgi:hypothetical protein
LYKSRDRGKSWKSIKGNIPDKTLVWRIVQDHVNPELLFIGTEFGIYFTVDGGNIWTKLSGGVPTISFRDLAIQRRENDLAGASFGRSFYVFDDYSVLRHVSEDQLKEEATLFPVRDTWWYMPRTGKGKLGASDFVAPNPPFGAVFTYYLAEGYKTDKTLRQEKEKELVKKNEPITFPGWEAVEAERRQGESKIWLTITDDNGYVIRKIKAPVSKGFHRVAWDLKYPGTMAIDIHTENNNAWGFKAMAAPGTYTVSMSKEIDGEVSPLSEPISFEVKQLREGALEGSTPEKTVAFWKEIQDLQGQISATSIELSHAIKKVKGMQLALSRTGKQPGELDGKLYQTSQDLQNIQEQLYGNPSKNEIGEKNNPTVRSRLRAATSGVENSTYGPTPTHERSLELAEKEYKELQKELNAIVKEKIPNLENQLKEAGAPEIKG